MKNTFYLYQIFHRYKVKQASISCSIKETESIHMTFIIERINEFEIFYGLEEMSKRDLFLTI